MRVTIQRTKRTASGAIIGTLSVDGVRKCYSMERADKAIPVGIYELELTFSPHFGKTMPLLNGVVGRTDIRIHPANVPSQLEGCIAVDLSCDEFACSDSVLAFDPLLASFKETIARGEAVTVSVQDVPQRQPDKAGPPLSKPLIASRPDMLQLLSILVQTLFSSFQRK